MKVKIKERILRISDNIIIIGVCLVFLVLAIKDFKTSPMIIPIMVICNLAIISKLIENNHNKSYTLYVLPLAFLIGYYNKKRKCGIRSYL